MMSPTFMLPSNKRIIPEKRSPKTDWRPRPIPTNNAAEPAIKKVILTPIPCIEIIMAMV